MIRFGLSTRLYLFGGPEELRPAEGLSKLQRRQLAALEVWFGTPLAVCIQAKNKKTRAIDYTAA